MASAEQTIPYPADLEKISFQTRDMSPRILDKRTYYNWLDQNELRAGLLSNEGILKAMEDGLIKISFPNGPAVLMDRIQTASVDVSLGSEFWVFGQNEISRIDMGDHRQTLQNLDMLKFGYKPDGQYMLFHRDRFLLAMTAEEISLSNVIMGQFDGRSSVARLGLASHQTAGGIEPTFRGRIVMEFSNQNDLDVGVRVGTPIATLRFEAMSSPATLLRIAKSDSTSMANNQIAPFGYWNPEWDAIREQAIRKVSLSQNGGSNGN